MNYLGDGFSLFGIYFFILSRLNQVNI